MDALKTYHSVNRADANLSFGISRMEDIYDKRKGKTDEPHRHNFYTILFVKKGGGLHKIDFNTYEIKENQVFFIGPGQVHQLLEKEKSFGYSIVFLEEFLNVNQITTNFIDDINLFNDYESTPPLNLDDSISKILNFYAEQKLQLHHSNSPHKFEAIGALLKLFLIQCHSICPLNDLDYQTQESGSHVLRDFKKMIDENYKEWHQTKKYAQALNITPDHLNRVVKTLTGKTAKEHLQSRITTAAKRLLFFSKYSTKEIAYELGFSEPANFSAFFKKCTGVSPSVFKETN